MTIFFSFVGVYTLIVAGYLVFQRIKIINKVKALKKTNDLELEDLKSQLEAERVRIESKTRAEIKTIL